MKVLVLGGTRLIGRAVCVQPLVSGHDVSLFNRGSLDDMPAALRADQSAFRPPPRKPPLRDRWPCLD